MLFTEAAGKARIQPDNPYLTGVHTPMTEELTLRELPVTGVIPAALTGRYLRMGPNPMAPNIEKHHWFAGDGMIHGLRLEAGRAVWYRNRWIRSDAVARALDEPRTPGPRHLFDTVNTNVVGHAGKVLGVVEAGSTPVEIGDTLETLRYSDFSQTLKGGFTAHPHVDPLTGEMLGICYDASKWRSLRYVVVGAEGRVRREVRIPVKHGPMIHDFAFTRRFAIILDLPVTFSLTAAITGHHFPYRWNEAHPVRVGLCLGRAGPPTSSGCRWIRASSFTRPTPTMRQTGQWSSTSWSTTGCSGGGPRDRIPSVAPSSAGSSIPPPARSSGSSSIPRRRNFRVRMTGGWGRPIATPTPWGWSTRSLGPACSSTTSWKGGG
jgi:carotenoid cleavage dioxygenase-like enzyme